MRRGAHVAPRDARRCRSEEGGVLRWAAGETQFAIDVAFDDLGQVLLALGYAPTLVTDNGSASADLRWSGSPRALALATLACAVTLKSW